MHFIKLVNKKLNFKYLTIFLLLYTLLLTFLNISSDTMAFWFDPARDFILAVENLKKPTLIGPYSGIPGVFYGPYWIWLISLAMLVSLDPRVVTLLILALPYLLFVPYILYKLRKLFGIHTWIILWLLFFYNYLNYFNALWNPHLAPLLALVVIYLTISTKNTDLNRFTLLKIVLVGFFAGLITNFHISFGIALSASLIIYFVVRVLIIYKGQLLNILIHSIINITLLAMGIILSFTPFIIFEFRHGFNQIKSFYKTLTDAFLYNTASVGVTGLKKLQIVDELFKIFDKIFSFYLPTYMWILLLLISLIYFFIIHKNKRYKLDVESINFIILFITFILISLFVYLSSENPVWQYHFIGFEIFIIIYLGLLIRRIYILKLYFTILVILFSLSRLYSLVIPEQFNPLIMSSLGTKKYIVDLIYKDNNNNAFTTFTQSPSIYTYDFDYIFYWYSRKKGYKYPSDQIINNQPVYLIVTTRDQGIRDDFVNYKTPLDFKTEKTWEIDDGTVIIKRVNRAN